MFVYGFRPFGTYASNLSEQVVSSLSPLRGLGTHIFPVRFDRRMFLDAVEPGQPRFVVGVGQCPRGEHIRLEQRAVNRRRGDGTEEMSITDNGSAFLSSTLEFSHPLCRVSEDAGTYVCNFSMYVLLQSIGLWGGKFLFLHVPRLFPQKQAVHCLETLVQNCILSA